MLAITTIIETMGAMLSASAYCPCKAAKRRRRTKGNSGDGGDGGRWMVDGGLMMVVYPLAEIYNIFKKGP